MSAPEVKAVLFDVDGTLIDSNDLHVEAWLETFRHFHVKATEEQVRADLGKGGDQLVPDFVPDADLKDLQPRIEAFRADPLCLDTPTTALALMRLFGPWRTSG